MDNFLGFTIGCGAGFVTGKALGKYLVENPEETVIYALHPVKDANDALKKIRDAYSGMNVSLQENAGFNEDGDLEQRIQTTDWLGKPKISKEVNNYVKLLKFMNISALRVKVYDSPFNKIPNPEGEAIHNYLSQL
jgi:hypothetical protein